MKKGVLTPQDLFKMSFRSDISAGSRLHLLSGSLDRRDTSGSDAESDCSGLNMRVPGDVERHGPRRINDLILSDQMGHVMSLIQERLEKNIGDKLEKTRQAQEKSLFCK